MRRIYRMAAASGIAAADARRAGGLRAEPCGADGDAEGLPNVVLEAMAEGVPVVASRHAGIPEAVVHEVTGLLVPPGDPEALAAALRRLIVAPELRRRLGSTAREIAAERFGAIAQSRRLEAILLRVIAGLPG